MYAGLEDEFWTYRTILPATDGVVAFFAKGIDYRFDILLGNEKLLSQEGMFTPIRIDLTGRLDSAKELRIVIHPAPKDLTANQGNHEPRRSAKAAVSYGWDFHPRLIPLGIWDEAGLTTEAPWNPEVSYRLSEDLQTVDVMLGGGGEWEIYAPDGGLVAKVQGSDTATRLLNPLLWWPHDQGAPNLYTFRVRSAGRQRDLKVGFRRTRLVMYEGAWEIPAGVPDPPTTLEINGRKIFVKGSNWVSPEVFPGLLSEGLYRQQLDLTKAANMNLLRMWGGAVAQKDDFYDLCDEYGIMVWQEFPLACNRYPDDESYLAILDQESRSILLRLRTHPSIVLWCGGNELFCTWSGMTNQSLPLRLLDANCLELAPQVPFLPTSPIMGMKHGGYCFREPGDKTECWSIFQGAPWTAYPEFGCGGIASVETLRSFIPPDEEFPPRRGTAWEDHHAFDALLPDTWLDLPAIEHYFGPSASLEELVSKGQIMQSEGFRGLYEEARRQKPRCGMALNWCLNEPWPTAANNSLISWPCEPKPALKAVGEACRPALASARISRFLWRAGEWFDPEIWILNDSPLSVRSGTLVASVDDHVLLTWEYPEIAPNQNLRGPIIGFQLPELAGDRFELRLVVAGHVDLNTTYTLAFHS
jgi:beta-mannosidase